jgi:hypothetical protein
MISIDAEVLRAGSFTDSSGTRHTFGPEALLRIVHFYDPIRNPAPVVLGHPSDSQPVYGWVTGLKAQDDRLLAFMEVSEELASMIQRGAYKKRSCSFSPDLRLKHVGFLGAVPPAVKGLRDITFSGGQPFLEFQDEITCAAEKLNRLTLGIMHSRKMPYGQAFTEACRQAPQLAKIHSFNLKQGRPIR